MANHISSKQALIDKANSTVVIVAGAAAFILMFSLVASKTLISQAGYQNRVITAKRQALTQIHADITASATLEASYQRFIDQNVNVIGGSSVGTGPQDGDNKKIILDALPSTYDFPALATSLEKILTDGNLAINNITGTDDEVNQSGNVTSATPQPVAMPFEITVGGDYESIQNLISEFEHSTRPFQIQKIDISGDQGKLTADITAQTFYQPAKSLKITTKVVK